MNKTKVRLQASHQKNLSASNTSSENQRAIVLSALRDSPKTTIELRHGLGVMMPAARVRELREQGYTIDTVRITSLTPDGIKHSKVAKYVLRNTVHE